MDLPFIAYGPDTYCVLLGKVISVTSNIIIFMASFQTLSQALCHKAPALAVLMNSEPEFAKLELTELKFEGPEFDDWKVSFICFYHSLQHE